MSAEETWIYFGGPEPEPLRSALDALRDLPPATEDDRERAVARFFATLRAAGLEPIEHPFPDHHRFAAADLAFGESLPVLMTAKEAVKCRRFADPRLWELPVAARLEPDGGRELVARIENLVRTRH